MRLTALLFDPSRRGPHLLTDDGKICFSEDTSCRIMPKHIKKAGDRYKQMCGCQCCVICKDMHQNLKLWRKRYIKTKQQEIDGMQARSRLRTTKTEQLASYKLKIMDDHDVCVCVCLVSG